LPVDDATAAALVKLYPSATNAWVESAIAGVASKIRRRSSLPCSRRKARRVSELRECVDEQVAQKAESDPDNAAALVMPRPMRLQVRMD